MKKTIISALLVAAMLVSFVAPMTASAEESTDLTYKQFKILRESSDFLIDFYHGNGVDYYRMGLYLMMYYPDQIDLYRKGAVNENGELTLSNSEFYLVVSATLLDEVYYDIFPEAPDSFYANVARPNIKAVGEFITAYTDDGTPTEIKLGYYKKKNTYAWEMKEPDYSPICAYAGCIKNGDSFTFYYLMLKSNRFAYMTVQLGWGDTVYYLNRDYVSTLPDEFYEPPKSAPLIVSQFKRVRATADFLYEYYFGLGASFNRFGYYMLDNYPDDVRTYREGFIGENGEVEISDWDSYYVVSAERLDACYYDICPAAPKYFYETVVYPSLAEEWYNDETSEYEQYRTVTAYTADGVPTEIHLGYDMEADTYGWEVMAAGGPPTYAYNGFVDNGDETYTFYYSRIEYGWKGTGDSPVGVYVIVGLDDEDVIAVDVGYLTALPDEYTIPPKVVKGDPDGDGEITVADALDALRVAAKLAVSTPELIECCDTDGDGEITVADALMILRVAAKLVDSL